MADKEVSADIAINAFLDAVRDIAAENPSFRSRLVDVLGFTVLYEGAEQFDGANPAAQAARWSEDAFKRIWNAAKVGEIKRALKDHDLATTDDMRGLTKGPLISLLYRRALTQAEETGRR